MKPGRLTGWIVLITGALLVSIGIGFCVLYFVEGIFRRIGEADQSLMFWYLPVLFIGIFSASAGWALVAWARKRIKQVAAG
jgi:hypothetical protein